MISLELGSQVYNSPQLWEPGSGGLIYPSHEYVQRLRQYGVAVDESIDDIPESLNVSIRALRESTGEMVMTKEDAKTALKDLDESLAKYQQLLKCVQS